MSDAAPHPLRRDRADVPPGLALGAALRRGAAERSAEFLPGNVVARYLEVYAEALARRKGSGAAWTS